jgi:hypothetical protein
MKKKCVSPGIKKKMSKLLRAMDHVEQARRILLFGGPTQSGEEEEEDDDATVSGSPSPDDATVSEIPSPASTIDLNAPSNPHAKSSQHTGRYDIEDSDGSDNRPIGSLRKQGKQDQREKVPKLVRAISVDSSSSRGSSSSKESADTHAPKKRPAQCTLRFPMVDYSVSIVSMDAHDTINAADPAAKKAQLKSHIEDGNSVHGKFRFRPKAEHTCKRTGPVPRDTPTAGLCTLLKNNRAKPNNGPQKPAKKPSKLSDKQVLQDKNLTYPDLIKMLFAFVAHHMQDIPARGHMEKFYEMISSSVVLSESDAPNQVTFEPPRIAVISTDQNRGKWTKMVYRLIYPKLESIISAHVREEDREDVTLFTQDLRTASPFIEGLKKIYARLFESRPDASADPPDAYRKMAAAINKLGPVDWNADAGAESFTAKEKRPTKEKSRKKANNSPKPKASEPVTDTTFS